MVLGVYAIRDVKVGFLAPTVERSELTAIRGFSHAVLNSTDILSSYAKDFALYRIGQYDNDTGVLTPEPIPVHVFEAVDALAGGEPHAKVPHAV